MTPKPSEPTESMELFAAEIWDNKYEPDKLGCIIERWCKMHGDDLIRKHRDNLYKRPISTSSTTDEIKITAVIQVETPIGTFFTKNPLEITPGYKELKS